MPALSLSKNTPYLYHFQLIFITFPIIYPRNNVCNMFFVSNAHIILHLFLI